MAKKKLDEKVFVTKDAREVIGENTIDAFRKNRAELSKYSDPIGRITKYSKKNIRQREYFIQGFDLMQYNIVVRDYIVKRYRLKNTRELDILTYLFPIQYFTRKDFLVLPLRQWNVYLKNMIEDGHVILKVKKHKRSANIYGLSENAIWAVKDYYLYLSGEKTMKMISKLNPFRYPEQTKIDMERERVMLKLKKQSENFPNLFKNYHD